MKNKYKPYLYEDVLVKIDDEIFNTYCDFCLHDYEKPFSVTIKCGSNDIFFSAYRVENTINVILTRIVNGNRVTKTKKLKLMR